MVGKAERNKDLIQEIVENTAHRVGSIASIITSAVVDVSKEIGGLISDGFEMREATKAAEADERRQVEGRRHELEDVKLHEDDDADGDLDADEDDSDEQY
ncbi:MAG: hypothetical protein QM774_07800 [Gordonia sp. (in: high G+C Gram-positive bacteria)]|uniref:hypothetical protein n=1 Tax=Gordonia sp. (in: high G+C Gram-positive bacteria) TaxID=84139 RepID=UPI0039E6E5D5